MKTIIISMFIAVCLLLCLNIEAQVTQQWVQRYNGPANGIDNANSLAVDASGNVYVMGSSEGNGTGYDYATIKYNSSGVQQWVQRYNGPGNGYDAATSLAVDASGNVYVTGQSTGSGTNFDYATIKYNSSGAVQWVQRYNGPGNNWDAAFFLAVDGSGNVYVTGTSTVSGLNSEYATIKYNSSGVQQWVQRYNGPANLADIAGSLAVDASGNVYVTGQSTGSGTSQDYATIKYNSSGVEQWVQRYDGPANLGDYANSLAVDGSGNVYVTGQSWGSGTSEDYATIKYNSSGVQQWVQRYNGPANHYDVAYSVKVDATGNVYVTGTSTSGTLRDYATIKYNSSGAEQWVQRYNGPANDEDYAYSLAVDASGNVYVTGGSVRTVYPDLDYATIKYNALGAEQWVQRYNGPGNGENTARSVAVDGSGNVYITGRSVGSGTNYDYATIKYSQTVGIQPVSSEIPAEFSLYQNYPNPFNLVTKIKFEIPNTNSKTEIRIYDALGKEAAILVNEELKPGRYEVNWDASNYPSGVYFYTLISENFKQTKSMVLIK